MIGIPLVSADVKLKILCPLATFVLMDPFILAWNSQVLKVLGPEGDVSTSEGKGDLGAAQLSSLEVLTNTRNRWGREPLEPNGLEADLAVQTICGFWICKGTLTHLEWRWHGKKCNPGG